MARHFKGMRADHGHSQAIRKGWSKNGWHGSSGFHRCRVGCAECGFYANDFDIWFQRFNGTRNASNQSSTTNRYNNHIHIGDIINHFYSHCTGPGQNGWIVVAVDVVQAFLLHECFGIFLGFSNVLSVDNHASTKFPAPVNLGNGSHGWHDNRGGNIQLLPMIGQGLCVIASAGGNHSIQCFLFVFQLQNGVAGTSFLEGSCKLLTFVLDKDIGSHHFAQKG
mmetsp:Transcript_17282/g.47228  ORF Transcript_17282/g.47228 Transcript_17282/m.47228 type:complete len:222 (-) Transcript_17282:458-1123(-)